MRRLFFSALLLVLSLADAAQAEPVAVTAVAKPLDPDAPGETRFGRLEWRGTLELSSQDPRFGGYSGLLLGPEGRELLAVSDTGHWLRGQIELDAANRLTGFSEAEILPLLDETGAPLAGKEAGGDAEALARGPEGRLLVSFERDHRILAYESLDAAGVEIPTGFGLPPNGNEGIEALAKIPDGRLLVLIEGTAQAAGQGHLHESGAWRALGYRRTRSLLPVGAAAAEDGTVYVVERSWSLIGGLEIRIVRLAAESVRPGAELAPEELVAMKPPLLIDNFEAIAAYVTPRGETLLLLLSDDNFNAAQRTLLTLFAVVK